MRSRDWRERYRDKLTTAREALRLVRRNRREQRPFLRLLPEKMPIDEPGRPGGGEHGGRAQGQRPRLLDRRGPAHGDAGEDRDVHDVVAPEIQDAAPTRFLESQPRDLAIAAVDDRVREQQQRAGELIRR